MREGGTYRGLDAYIPVSVQCSASKLLWIRWLNMTSVYHHMVLEARSLNISVNRIHLFFWWPCDRFCSVFFLAFQLLHLVIGILCLRDKSFQSLPQFSHSLLPGYVWISALSLSFSKRTSPDLELTLHLGWSSFLYPSFNYISKMWFQVLSQSDVPAAHIN